MHGRLSFSNMPFLSSSSPQLQRQRWGEERKKKVLMQDFFFELPSRPFYSLKIDYLIHKKDCNVAQKIIKIRFVKSKKGKK